MASPITILLVEDNPSDALLLRSQLGTVEEFEFAIDHAERISQARDMLGVGQYDAVLLDLGLPDSVGEGTVAQIREVSAETPILVLSGAEDRDMINAAMEMGADNFIVKGKADGNRIALGILYARNHRARKLSESTQSEMDFLSELENDLTSRLKAGALQLPEALNELMLALESHKDFDYKASVLLYNAEEERLYHGAAPNLPDAYNQAINGVKVGLGVGSCGTAVFCKHSIYVVDIETDPLWSNFRELARPHKLRACWSVPIFDDNETVLGTFAMYYATRRSPSEEEREFIHGAARVAARIISGSKNQA